ncbi:Ig-like domain-containing protein [Clostridium rectalis]|uniref:Ig-like domain-containing protein n=1 Tax=Clostridium rectalis TaxID=2040295 RepID=UPI000F643E37|nr:Ig-like domain-containing protein [Clostridium rectalis]
MKNWIKKLVVFLFVFFSLLGSKCEMVLASEKMASLGNAVSVNIDEREYGKDVQADKVWKIRFNQSMEMESLKNNIKIIDTESKKDMVLDIFLEENDTVTIIKPKNLKDGTYCLIVNSDVTSKVGKHLKRSIQLNFNVVLNKKEELDSNSKEAEENKDLYIKYIEDINVNINQYESFILPYTVKAVMSDGKIKNLDVFWKESVQTTDVPGKHVYTGLVNGYKKDVVLNLNIKELKKQNTTPHSKLQKNLCNYLMDNNNRQFTMKRAIELHGGDPSNTCVYFASEALRRAGLKDLDEQVCNTVTLTKELKNRGWSTSTDLSELAPGDICFTISYGYGPTHAYTFMNWVNEEDYNYAYICDNQGNEYGNAYHQRNIDFQTSTKDKISYFMYKI